MTRTSSPGTNGKTCSDGIRLTITLDPADWWDICSRAEEEGREAADVVRDGVLVAGGRRAVARADHRVVQELEALHERRARLVSGQSVVDAGAEGRRSGSSRRDVVERLVREGRADGEISVALNVPRNVVAAERRARGLKPNQPGLAPRTESAA